MYGPQMRDTESGAGNSQRTLCGFPARRMLRSCASQSTTYLQLQDKTRRRYRETRDLLQTDLEKWGCPPGRWATYNGGNSYYYHRANFKMVGIIKVNTVVETDRTELTY